MSPLAPTSTPSKSHIGGKPGYTAFFGFKAIHDCCSNCRCPVEKSIRERRGNSTEAGPLVSNTNSLPSLSIAKPSGPERSGSERELKLEDLRQNRSCKLCQTPSRRPIRIYRLWPDHSLQLMLVSAN